MVIQVLVCEPETRFCFIDAHHRKSLFTEIISLKHAQNIRSQLWQFGVTLVLDTDKKVYKPNNANVSFKSESHCKSINSCWRSTGGSEALTVNGEWE